MDFTNLVTLEVVTIVGEAIAKNGNLSVRSSGEKNQPGSKMKGIEVPHPGIPWPGELGSHSSRCNSI